MNTHTMLDEEKDILVAQEKLDGNSLSEVVLAAVIGAFVVVVFYSYWIYHAIMAINNFVAQERSYL